MLDLIKSVFSDSACAWIFWTLMFAVTLLIIVVDICIVSINRKNRECNKKKGDSHDFKQDPQKQIKVVTVKPYSQCSVQATTQIPSVNTKIGMLPPICVEQLLGRESFNHYILEPCCGSGHIAEVLKAHGHQVQCIDLIDRGYPNTIIKDFLTTTKADFPMSPDIITNPPYSIATEFVKHCLDISMDSTKIAMLLKIQFLESKKRWELFKNNPPKKVYVFVNRVNCGRNGVFGKESSAVCYAWFIWEKGYQGKPKIDWIV